MMNRHSFNCVKWLVSCFLKSSTNEKEMNAKIEHSMDLKSIYSLYPWNTGNNELDGDDAANLRM